MSEKIPVIKLNSTRSQQHKAKAKWWSEPTDEVWKDVLAVSKAVSQNQETRSKDNLMFARLYGNMELTSLTAFNPAMLSRGSRPKNRVTLNVCKAAIDTVVAKIAKNKPKPLFLTEEGNWEDQQKAEKLTQYVTGVFMAAETYQQGQVAFTDGCVFGTGCVKVYIDDWQIKTERVLIDEIKVDETEGMYGQPRSLFQTKRIQKEVLIGDFPDHIDAIMNGGSEPGTNTASSEGVSEMIDVVEAWHLPSTKGGDDGLHVIAIDGATLLSEPWAKCYFPFAFIRWSPKTLGFYGGGICEEVLGIQIEVNKILKNVQDSMHLFAVPRVYRQAGSAITKSLNNQIGAEYEYQGSPPQFLTPQAMSRDTYEHLWNLYAKAFEIVGVSQLSATSKKPAGLDSGVALREYNDIETERFVLAGQRYEDFYMRLARIVIDLTRDMMESKDEEAKKKIKPVKIKGHDFMKKIEWSEVSLDDDAYIMQVFPASLLPNTPAGRMEYVNDLQEKGWIQPEQAMSLLDFPDVKEFTSLQTAALKNTKRIIGKMLHDGQYEPPDPLMDLQLALKMTQMSYLRAKLDGAPESRLDLLAQYIQEILDMVAPDPTEQGQQGAPAPDQGMIQDPMAGVPPEAMPPQGMAPQGAPPQLPPQMPVQAPPAQ